MFTLKPFFFAPVYLSAPFLKVLLQRISNGKQHNPKRDNPYCLTHRLSPVVLGGRCLIVGARDADRAASCLSRHSAYSPTISTIVLLNHSD
jgi:hypothetical protein